MCNGPGSVAHHAAARHAAPHPGHETAACANRASSRFKFSNSAASSGLAKRFPAGVFRSSLSMCASHKCAERVFAPHKRAEPVFTPRKRGARLAPKERERSAVTARIHQSRAPAKSTQPVLRSTGLALRRSTAAFSIPGTPLAFDRGCPAVSPPGPGKAQGTSPGRHHAPGGRSRDSREQVCETCARAPLPIRAQFRSAERPSANRDDS